MTKKEKWNFAIRLIKMKSEGKITQNDIDLIDFNDYVEARKEAIKNITDLLSNTSEISVLAVIKAAKVALETKENRLKAIEAGLIMDLRDRIKNNKKNIIAVCNTLERTTCLWPKSALGVILKEIGVEVINCRNSYQKEGNIFGYEEFFECKYAGKIWSFRAASGSCEMCDAIKLLQEDPIDYLLNRTTLGNLKLIVSQK